MVLAPGGIDVEIFANDVGLSVDESKVDMGLKYDQYPFDGGRVNGFYSRLRVQMFSADYGSGCQCTL